MEQRRQHAHDSSFAQAPTIVCHQESLRPTSVPQRQHYVVNALMTTLSGEVPHIAFVTRPDELGCQTRAMERAQHMVCQYALRLRHQPTPMSTILLLNTHMRTQ